MIIAPKLKFCIKGKCDKITLTDNTGLYNNTTNLNAWSNNQVLGNIPVSLIISAKVAFSDINGVQKALYILKNTSGVNLYPAQATNSFDFPEQSYNLEDGIYDIIYAVGVLNPDVAVDYKDRVLVTCKAEACISGLWIKYNNSGSKEDQETALLAESLLKGVKASFVCNKFTNVSKINETLAKVCALANGDCGCGCS